MSLKGLLNLLVDHPAYRHITEKCGLGQVARGFDIVGGKPLLIASLWNDLKFTTLVITPRPDGARRLYEQLSFYLGQESPILLLPEPDVLPFERLAADAYTNNQRLMALDALRSASKNSPTLVIASLSAVLLKTLSTTTFTNCNHTFTVGQKVRLGDLTSRWVTMGYRREESVEIPGTFSVRGGIIDIFSPNSLLPARLDLTNNEIETIHFFDPATQRSMENANTIRVTVAQEILPLYADQKRVSDLVSAMRFTDCSTDTYQRIEDDLASLFSGHGEEDLSFYNGLINQTSILEYLDPPNLIILDGKTNIESEATDLETRIQALERDRVARGDLPANFPAPYFSWEEVKDKLNDHRLVDLSPWNTENGGGDFGFLSPPSYYGQLDQLCAAAHQIMTDGHSIIVVTRHSKRLAEILSERGLDAVVVNRLEEIPSPGCITIVAGSLDQGWVLPILEHRTVLLTDTEVFGTVKEHSSRVRRPVKRAPFLSQLETGCYVVHEDHGIARFGGTTSINTNGDDREYLILEYAEKDKLYLPTDHLDRISPYMASSDKPPTLTRLSGTEWARAKERVKASAQDLAKQLLDLYAKRQVVQGHAFSADLVWQQELEDAFPYEETPDQIRAIEEVKEDMEHQRPMDRLVCGDVGYGKTEVALRAAFKAVADGMQAALLVPTTILAQQHYNAFRDRMSPYPLRVDMLSRFRNPKEQRQTVEDLKLGAIDIVIGTHRLLQKDVRFKNLGLVIIDEEQRFGVGHKERLKGIMQDVDFLTLSATPIPRTLYMALSGIRDMSTLETPPDQRFPVKTYVGEFSDQIVSAAILRELDRGGQVFFLHNRIASIRRTADYLAQLVPRARFAVAHGRMAEEQLEKQMFLFNSGEIDVLVCTSIIESGLDIPNANTLIIDRADRFGLSQLYQLRGRVGRSTSRAYSYLLIPKGRRITPASEKRLRAILEASELGSGFRIAMRDLEIRGAGNLLGSEQSGYIHAVGFELYTQLLNQAVSDLREQRGETPSAKLPPRSSIRVDLPISAYIPQNYISHLPNRLAIYQRLSDLQQPVQLEDIEDELRDRFGPLPKPLESLLYIISLKTIAREAGILSIVSSNGTIALTLEEPVGGARLAMEKALGNWAKIGNTQIRLNHRLMGPNWQKGLVTILKCLKDFQERISQLPVH